MKSLYRRIIWGARFEICSVYSSRKQSKTVLTGLLKQPKASIDIANQDGNNAIWKLSQVGHTEGVKFLLALGAKPGS